MYFLLEFRIGSDYFRYTTNSYDITFNGYDFLSGNGILDVESLEKNSSLEQQDFNFTVSSDVVVSSLLSNGLDLNDSFKMYYSINDIESGTPQLYFNGHLTGFNIQKEGTEISVKTNYNILDYTYGRTISKDDLNISGNNLLDQLSVVDSSIESAEDTQQELEDFISEYNVQTPQWYRVDKWFSGSISNDINWKQAQLDLVNTRITNLNTIKQLQGAKLPIVYGSAWIDANYVGKVTVRPENIQFPIATNKYYYILATEDFDISTSSIVVNSQMCNNTTGNEYTYSDDGSFYFRKVTGVVNEPSDSNGGLLGDHYIMYPLNTDTFTLYPEDYTVLEIIDNGVFGGQAPTLKVYTNGREITRLNEILLDYITESGISEDNIDISSFNDTSDYDVNIVINPDKTVAENIQILCKDDNSTVYYKNGLYTYKRLKAGLTPFSTLLDESLFLKEPRYFFDYSNRLKKLTITSSYFSASDSTYIDYSRTNLLNSNYTNEETLEISVIDPSNQIINNIASTWADLYNNARKFECTVPLTTGYNLKINDVVTVSYDFLGFDSKLFYVENININLMDGSVDLSLLDYDDSYFNSSYDYTMTIVESDRFLKYPIAPTNLTISQESEVSDGTLKAPIIIEWDDYGYNYTYEVLVDGVIYETKNTQFKFYNVEFDRPYVFYVSSISSYGYKSSKSVIGINSEIPQSDIPQIENLSITESGNNFSLTWDYNYVSVGFKQFKIDVNNKSYYTSSKEMVIFEDGLDVKDFTVYVVDQFDRESIGVSYSIAAQRPILPNSFLVNQSNSNEKVITWSYLNDIQSDDLLGHEIRYSLNSNKDWDKAIKIHKDYINSSPYRTKLSIQGDYVLMLKSVDTNYNYSEDTKYITFNQGELLIDNLIESYDLTDGFTGTKNNMILDGDELVVNQLDDLFYYLDDNEAFYTKDNSDNFYNDVYNVASYIHRVSSNANGLGVINYVGSGDVGIYYRELFVEPMYDDNDDSFYTDDNYYMYNDIESPYEPYIQPFDIKINRPYEIKIEYNEQEKRGRITDLEFIVDGEDILHSFDDVLVSATNTTFYSNKIDIVKNVSVTLQDDGGSAESVRVINKTDNSFTLACYDSTGTKTSGIVDVIAKGYKT